MAAPELDLVHGEVGRARGQLVPHPLQLLGRERQPVPRRGRARHERHLPPLHRRSAGLHGAADVLLRPQHQLVQALRVGLVRTHHAGLGHRQPHLRLSRRRARQRPAPREPDAGRRLHRLPGLRGHHRGRPARHRRAAPAGGCLFGQRLRRQAPAPHPKLATRRHRAPAGIADGARGVRLRRGGPLPPLRSDGTAHVRRRGHRLGAVPRLRADVAARKGAPMSTTVTKGLLIAGERGDAAEGRSFEVLNPATGMHLANVAEAGVEDVNRAVAAAVRAYGQWGTLSPVTRGRHLHRFAALVEEHGEELALLECRNVGMPISDARGQLSMIIDVIRYYAGAVDKFFGHTVPVERDGVAMTFREPIGVGGLITPWNFPLNIANWKIAPALAAGNTVVLKPASLTPLSVLRYAELAAEAGLPAGALNVVPGPGGTVGGALVAHPDVGKIGFPGSTAVGAGIARAAAATIKRVTLELGGKSACVVFEDADIEKVGALAPFAVFENCGQDCCARSRLIVQRSVKDELVERYAATTTAIRVGMPELPDTQVGPMISAGQRDTVEGYIATGVAEGARVVTGGDRPGGDLESGFFLRPAVLDDVANEMTVAREEIFGPVVGVIPFDTEEQAIAIANDTPYGLSGSLWTRDGARQLRVARALRTGVLGVNTNSSVFVQMPFGGYKQSGVGKELGMHALEHNTELKSVFISTE